MIIKVEHKAKYTILLKVGFLVSATNIQMLEILQFYVEQHRWSVSSLWGIAWGWNFLESSHFYYLNNFSQLKQKQILVNVQIVFEM